MLLKIDFNEKDVIHKGNGRIILKLNYYAQYSIALHLCSVKGNTFEDFEDNDALKSKTVFVGNKGGIS